MDKKDKWYKIESWAKSLLIVGTTLIFIFIILENFSDVLKFLKKGYLLISPFLWGIALAYLMSLMMIWFERRLLAKITKKKLKRVISLSLTLIIVVAFIAGFLFSVIPQLAFSLTSLVNNISGYIDNSEELVMGWADSLEISREFIDSVFGNWEDILLTLTDFAISLLPGLYTISVKIGTGIVKSLVSLFVAIYILVDLENVLQGTRRFFLAVFGEKNYVWLEMLRVKAHKAFGGFLAGKILDSSIVGVICFIFMMICGMPHALLISFVIGITDVIPIFGPFLGAIPSIFILFIINPVYALWFSIFILVLQQIDGKIIAPYILGDALGLSSLWTLVAVIFFGTIWGIAGMILGVPLFAVIHDLTTEFVKARLEKFNELKEDNEVERKEKKSSIFRKRGNGETK